MESFSNLATPVSIAVLLVVITAFAPGKRAGWCSAANLVCALALNQILKAIVQRPRPDGFRLAEASGFSFPLVLLPSCFLKRRKNPKRE